jgi:hypothetical protein
VGGYIVEYIMSPIYPFFKNFIFTSFLFEEELVGEELSGSTEKELYLRKTY